MRLALVLALAAFAAPARADLLITDVVIVSAERRAPSPPVSVHIDDGGRIAEIAPRPSRRASRARERIDGRGRFLTPGLIDGHTHLDEIPGMGSQHEAQEPALAAAARRQIPLSYLFHGFTTLVDLNGQPEAIARWNAAPLRPQARFCGGAAIVDGYPMSFMPRPARYRIMPYFLFDPARAADFPAGFDPAEHSPEAVVARAARDGAVCIKTHYEPGWRRSLPVPGATLVRALAAAAHRRGLPLLLHANKEEAQAFGLGAGVDGFAHGLWSWNDRAATAMPASVRAILDQVIARRLAWQPTIQVLYGERDLFDPAFLADPELARVVPQALLDWYGSEPGRWWQQRMLGGEVRTLVDAGRWAQIDAEPIARVRQATAYLAAHGGRLLFGSDTPSDPTFANPPGLNGRREMRRWIEAGVSPAILFRAATIENARFFGLDREIGTVARGKRADLLLMARNPMTDGSAYDSIETVIVGGRALARASLAADRP